MTRAQVVGLSVGGALVGGGLLVYLVTTVPPRMSDGVPNAAALVLALVSGMVLVWGLGTMLALALHRRWPGLAGRSGQLYMAQPEVAMRQGALLAVGLGFIAVLAYLQMLDAPFFIVTILMLILFEAFVQSRS